MNVGCNYTFRIVTVARQMSLNDVSFGDRVAENEADRLANYFVSTEQWENIKNGKSDVVFGAKGAGKSALYTLLLASRQSFSEQDIVLLTVERPKGKPVFSDITNDPPTSEDEFISLWKIYFCQLLIKHLKENSLCVEKAKIVENKLKEAGLIEEENTLRQLLNSAKEFVKNLLAVESLEAGATLEGGITGKITFRTPSNQERKEGYVSIDDLIEKLDNHFKDIGRTFWILSDRLDVAFDESQELEENALRALFKVYRDLEGYDNIKLKIFLRDDIWKRITEKGFREASHITKSTTIQWNEKNLLNLIVMRILDNRSLCQKYSVDIQKVQDSYEEQVDIYYKLFPEQVDVGEKQSETFNWILNRVKDGLGNVAPRELIHYHNEIITQERRAQDINNNTVEDPNLVSRQAIKSAAQDVSKVRIEQTLFAEYPQLKQYIMALENSKAEHNLRTLSAAWKLSEESTVSVAQQLNEIGFFDQTIARTEKTYKIPFLYRFHLNISQGKAF